MFLSNILWKHHECLRSFVVRLTSLHFNSDLSFKFNNGGQIPSTTFVYYKVRSAWPDDTSVQRVNVRIIPCTYIIGVRSSSVSRICQVKQNDQVDSKNKEVILEVRHIRK